MNNNNNQYFRRYSYPIAENFEEIYGNSKNFNKSCSKCHLILNEIQNLYEQITKLSDRIKIIEEELKKYTPLSSNISVESKLEDIQIEDIE